MEQITRLQASYERAIAALSQHSLQAMERISQHAATAFSAAVVPFADVNKTLVKALDDSRAQSASTAKDSQALLIEALTNRIIESTKAGQPGVAQDIKDVMQLLPLFKGLLGDKDPKPS